MQICYPGFPCFKKNIIFSSIAVFRNNRKTYYCISKRNYWEKFLKMAYTSVAAEYLRKGCAKNDEIEVSSISVFRSFFLLCKVYQGDVKTKKTSSVWSSVHPNILTKLQVNTNGRTWYTKPSPYFLRCL